MFAIAGLPYQMHCHQSMTLSWLLPICQLDMKKLLSPTQSSLPVPYSWTLPLLGAGQEVVGHAKAEVTWASATVALEEETCVTGNYER